MAIPDALANRLAPWVQMQDGPGDGGFPGVTLAGVREAADYWAVVPREAMARLLTAGMWPLRFARNRGIFSSRDQASLLRSAVAVIGCGGLGGHVATLLARLGVGAITLCDYDVFDESNLNRQAACREDSIGKNKAVILSQEVASIASHVEIRTMAERATAANLPAILDGAGLALDCLDSLDARVLVETAAHRLGISFIHAALAGEEGFVSVSRPGEERVGTLYGGAAETAELKKGVPTLTPVGVAVLEAELAVRELLVRGGSEAVLWHLDLSALHIDRMLL